MKDYKAGRTIGVKALDASIAGGHPKRGRKWPRPFPLIRSNPPYQSIRLDQGPRAKVLVDGDTMVFLDLDQDHDKTCGRK